MIFPISQAREVRHLRANCHRVDAAACQENRLIQCGLVDMLAARQTTTLTARIAFPATAVGDGEKMT